MSKVASRRTSRPAAAATTITATSRRRTATPPASDTAPPPGDEREKDAVDLFAEATREKIEEYRARRARVDAQERDEAPAWRASTDDSKTLRTLIAMASACSEDGNAGAFESGALMALEEDLNILCGAVWDDNDAETGYLSYGEVRTAIWRLAQKAKALHELCARFNRAEHAAKAVTS